jgi:hypothetical protein
VPSVFSCTQREEVQARSFRKKGYSESLRTFQIDIPAQRQIETRRDIFLEEEILFQRSRESHMEIDSKKIPSPPSAVQRETDITLVDPVVPVDMFRDIAVGHKIPTWTHSARGKETYKPLNAHPAKEKEIFELSFSHEPPY